MNKNQYKRLFLILLIPLVGFGWWGAANEIFTDGTYLIECENYQNKDVFSCYSRLMTAERLRQYKYESGGVYIESFTEFPVGFLHNSTRLTTGFHEKIITVGAKGLAPRNGVLQGTKVIGAGEVKDINLEGNVGEPRYYNGQLIDLPGSCNLDRFSNKNDMCFIDCTFALRCTSGVGVTNNFKFLDIITESKYRELFVLSAEKHRENSRNEIIIYVFSLLLPLIIFTTVSGLFFLLMKMVSYVRYGSKSI